MAKSKEKIEVHIIPSKTFEIKPGHKYLMIMPKDAQLNKIAKAISNYFDPVPVFLLAVNDVNEIKIAELLKRKR